MIAAGGADPRYPVTAAPCPASLAPTEAEAHTVACGSVNVPEDHDDPDGRRIDLTFMVLKSHSLSPAAQGARAGQSEMGIQALGYQAVRTEGLTTYWLNRGTGACAQIVTADGRYESVVMVPSSNC